MALYGQFGINPTYLIKNQISALRVKLKKGY